MLAVEHHTRMWTDLFAQLTAILGAFPPVKGGGCKMSKAEFNLAHLSAVATFFCRSIRWLRGGPLVPFRAAEAVGLEPTSEIRHTGSSRAPHPAGSLPKALAAGIEPA